MRLTRTIRMTLLGFLVAFFAVMAGACQPPASKPTERGSQPPTMTVAPASNWYTIYFTSPGDPQSGKLRGGPDKSLADAIDTAQVSVDMAVLQLNLWSIRDALIRAHRRGVQVRVVIESDYQDEDEIQALLDADIPVLGDRREGLMHNKFTIVDRQEVWTGSMNYSTSDGYRNNNHLIRIRSAELAQDYLVEFEEMFNDDAFGPGSPANTPKPELNINGVNIQVCFSPDDGCAERLERLIASAQHSIHFLAFSFTSDPLAEALIERARTGVEVSGVMEASQLRSNAGTDFQRFQQAGINVHPDDNEYNMHHKVIIVDGRYVATGSYNFSYYAETRNDENSLIIDSPQIAAQFEAEFHRLLAQAE